MLKYTLAIAISALLASTVSVTTAQQSGDYRLSLTGPNSVEAGGDITYVVEFEVAETPPVTAMFFTTPPNTTFVSVTETDGVMLSGANVGEGSVNANDPAFNGQVVGSRNVELVFLPSANQGDMMITVRVDDGFSGQIEARANFRVTGLSPSNTVVTSIQRTTLPATGAGGSGAAALPWIAFSALGAGVLLVAGAIHRFGRTGRMVRADYD